MSKAQVRPRTRKALDKATKLIAEPIDNFSRPTQRISMAPIAEIKVQFGLVNLNNSLATNNQSRATPISNKVPILNTPSIKQPYGGTQAQRQINPPQAGYKLRYGEQFIQKSPQKEVKNLKFGALQPVAPPLRRCATSRQKVSDLLQQHGQIESKFVTPTKNVTPPKYPKQFLVAPSSSPHAAALPAVQDSRYQATSRWNDMVQDDEIERLMNCHHIRYTDSNSKFQQQNIVHATDRIDLSRYDNMLPGYGNFGNTCFANSVIQCLVHTPALREYCRLGRHSEGCTIKKHAPDLNQINIIRPMNAHYSGTQMKNLQVVQDILNSTHFCAFCVLEKHVKALLDVKEPSCLPLAIIILISKIGGGDMFHIGRQSDAQEFLYILLANFTQASFGYLEGVPFSYEKQTFIPRLFQGKLEKHIICSLCKKQTIRVEDFLNLSLNLVTKGGSSQSCKQKVDFHQSLKDYFKTDTLDSENKLTCNECGRKNQSKTFSRLRTLPRNLIIHMIRFDALGNKLMNNIDFPHKFSFPKDCLCDTLQKHESQGWISESSDSSTNLLKRSLFQDSRQCKFTHKNSSKSHEYQQSEQHPHEQFKQHEYHLHSMIIHHGYRSSSGHYFCICKVQTNKERDETHWVKFDDDKITFVPEDEIDSWTQKAYLLFYRRCWNYKEIKKPKLLKTQTRFQQSQELPFALKRAQSVIVRDKEVSDFDKGLHSSPEVIEIKQQIANPETSKRQRAPTKNKKVLIDLTDHNHQSDESDESLDLDSAQKSTFKRPATVAQVMAKKLQKDQSKQATPTKLTYLQKRLVADQAQQFQTLGKRTRRH